MNKDTTPPPGFTVNAIATTSGLGVVDAAIAVTAVLGAIAGPKASFRGPAGETIRPGLSLIVIGSSSPAWNRAQDLLIAPLDACQRRYRNLSRNTTMAHMDQLQYGHGVIDHTSEIVGKIKEQTDDEDLHHYLDADRPFMALRQPSFFLQSPDLATLSAAMPEVLDRAPFLYYPAAEILSAALKKKPGKNPSALFAKLAEIVAGQDQAFAKIDERTGPGHLDTVHGHLLLTCSRQQLQQVLGSEVLALGQLLRRSIIIDPRPIAAGYRIDIPTMKYGYGAYTNSVNRIMHARRNATPVAWTDSLPERVLDIHKFTLDLQCWMDQLPGDLRPFFANATSLVYRVYWAMIATLVRGEPDSWAASFVTHVTKEVLHRQARLLGTLLGETERQHQEHARTEMLKKLGAGPCLFRNLVRRYSVQKREIHEPVLMELVSAGFVSLRDDGLIELSEEGRKELVA